MLQGGVDGVVCPGGGGGDGDDGGSDSGSGVDSPDFDVEASGGGDFGDVRPLNGVENGDRGCVDGWLSGIGGVDLHGGVTPPDGDVSAPSRPTGLVLPLRLGPQG